MNLPVYKPKHVYDHLKRHAHAPQEMKELENESTQNDNMQMQLEVT